MINQDEDRNTKNNEQEIKLGYADVSLKTTEYYHDNIIDVYAQISNLTARNADVELKVYEDSLDGDIVFQRTIKDVTNADSVVVPFELDRSKMNVTPGKDKLYIVKVTYDYDTNKNKSYLDKKVSSKKMYYYKVRAYKTVKGKKIYGAYSVVKKVKCK